MLANRRTANTLTSKPSRYLFAALVGGTGVILFVLGFIMPGWVWLVWVGFAFILAAIYYVRLWFMGPMLPNFKAWWEQHHDSQS